MDPSVDWSNLPKEMLELILERLKDPLDLLRFPGVCGSWFSIGRPILPLQLSILPPLLLFSDSTKQENQREIVSDKYYLTGRNHPRFSDEREIVFHNNLTGQKQRRFSNDREIVFHNYLTGKQRRFPFMDQFGNSCLLGGSHGWLISIQRGKPQEIHLINAISLAQIRLPNLNSFRLTNRLRIVMSANPLSDPNCMLLAIYQQIDHLEFCRLGDATWTRLSAVDMAHCSAATFYKGKFYVFKRTTGQITQIKFRDSRDPKVVTWKPRGLSDAIHDMSWHSMEDYLMESSGDLLLVTRTTCMSSNYMRRFKVHKLDCSMGVWIEVEDLGNRALFVGYNNSMSVVVPSAAAANEEYGASCSGFGRCRANAIYFVDDSDFSVDTLNRQQKWQQQWFYDMKTRDVKEWFPAGCERIWLRAPVSWIRLEA